MHILPLWQLFRNWQFKPLKQYYLYISDAKKKAPRREQLCEFFQFVRYVINTKPKYYNVGPSNLDLLSRSASKVEFSFSILLFQNFCLAAIRSATGIGLREIADSILSNPA